MQARPIVLADIAVLDDARFPCVSERFDDCEVVPYTARALGPHTPGLAAADAIVLRSVTRLDAATIAAAPRLRAVATLSSGTDHVDVAALEARGIALCTGHGGNARAVADWTLYALALGATRAGRPLSALTVGVVGIGAVGQAVVAMLAGRVAALRLCDPPRARREAGFRSEPLDALLAEVDAISLHVPLGNDGQDATRDLMSAARVEAFARTDRVLLNAARGEVLDLGAAATLRTQGRLGALCVDVFPGEPSPRARLVEACDLATPHVAGHSAAGKLRVNLHALDGLRAALGLPPAPPSLEEALAARARFVPPPAIGTGAEGLVAELEPSLGLGGLDAAFRATRGRGEGFDAIRGAHARAEIR